MRGPLRIAVVALALAYPLLAHLAARTGRADLTLACAGILALLTLAPGLAARRKWALAAAPVAALVLWLLARVDAALLPLFLPPVLINAFLAWAFGHTLVRGRVPLLERVVRLVHETEPEPRAIAYAGRLTAVWTALFVVLTLVNTVLALVVAPSGVLLTLGIEPPFTVARTTWSIWANLLNYVVVGLLFAGEYVLRSRLFPRVPYRNFADFVRRLVAVGPRLWRELRTEGTLP